MGIVLFDHIPSTHLVYLCEFYLGLVQVQPDMLPS